MPTLARAVALLSLALGFAMAPRAYGQTEQPAIPGASPDDAFLAQAYHLGKLEVRVARLACLRGSSSAVRDFGTAIIGHGADANERMRILAREGGAAADRVSPEELKTVQVLCRLRDSDFDRAFARAEADYYQRSCALFQHEATTGATTDVRSMAAAALPSLTATAETAGRLSLGQLPLFHRTERRARHRAGDADEPVGL